MIAKRSSLVMALLLALPQAALALGLGNIHLKSHLDQPLSARIGLVHVTPGALESLSVRLASRTAFTKYGLNYPSYLEGARIEVTHGAPGRASLQLTSRLPVTDPILTVLVKASWNRGVLYREYTILLNPPVYVPRGHQPHHVAVAAPVVGNAPRTGQLPQAHAASKSPASHAAVSPPAVAASHGPQSVRVHSGDTLWGIASHYSGGGAAAVQTRQWMVAIYRRNPRAFDHNMNLLRAGTVLRIPSRSAVNQVSSVAARHEVDHQDNVWRARGGASGSAGRLRLVAPHGPAAAGTGAGAGTASAQVGTLQAKVSKLQGELKHEKRLVQLKSQALAALQAQVAASKAAKAPAAPTAPPAAPPKKAAASASVTAHPTVKPQVPPRPAHAAVTHRAAPGTLAPLLRRYWWAFLVLLALIGAYVLAKVIRTRRESAADTLLTESADAGAEAQSTPAASDEPIDATSATAHAEDAIDVRETTHEQPRLVMDEDASPVVAAHVAADQTMSSETALNLDQGDPLAEADFHMAYGLYDQAADLIRIAIQREPERRDLKLKLLEVFFVWGNKDQFIETAHELAQTRDQAPAGEWDKVVIMGQQLAPDDPLFASSAVSGAASEGVDLDLEGGQGRVDFDLMGGGLPAGQTEDAVNSATGTTGAFDLDLGAALGEDASASDSGSGTDLNATLPDLETTGSETGVTQEMATQEMATQEMVTQEMVTQEMPGHPFGEETPAFEPAEPTVEQPALPVAEQAALREKVEALSQETDGTAELAIDDLGLDLGAFETTVQPGLGSDAPTLVAGLDEHSRDVLEEAGRAEQAAEGEEAPAAPHTSATSAWKIDERELENLLGGPPQQTSEPDTSATSRLSTLDASKGLDFDLGAAETAANEKTVVAPRAGNGLDFDIGTATIPHADLGTTQDAPEESSGASDLEPVTTSEVGTKLDLARAYMDMGDPEGARSILEEVMHEGSDSQRQEAGRLLESLPG